MRGETKLGWTIGFFILSALGMAAGAGLQSQGMVGVMGFSAVASIIYTGLTIWRD